MNYKLEYTYRGLTITAVANSVDEVAEFGTLCIDAVRDFSNRGLFYTGAEMKAGVCHQRTMNTVPSVSAPLASEKQKNLLRQLHVPFNEDITKDEASRLIDAKKGK